MKISRDDDLDDAVVICAVRYAMGSKSYMPPAVISAVLPLLPNCSTLSLLCLDLDIEQWLKENPANRENYWREWIKLGHAVRQELQERKHLHGEEV